MRTAGLLAATGAGAVLGGAALHLVPGVATLRRFRCAFLPALSGVGDAGHVALTFDDGPDPASTPAFLDALDALGWRATFFLLGEQVRRHPELAAEVAGRGHEVGAHGHRHSNHLLRSARWTRSDLQRAVDAVGDATGRAPSWFRPPYGALAASSLVAARDQQLPIVLWTSWGRDWRSAATPQSVVADIAGSWRVGATVLLHDSDITSAPRSWRAALDALPILAERWASQGLTVGPLAEHGIRRAPRRAAPRPA
ncbi:MAG: polysaccharide deacetylase family protein [Acidimicrobiaceae bacterium]|nr:polysaccharide deacetylase family protein [Acidimicrobiaceae bacterium]